MKHTDDYAAGSAHLKGLSDEQLRERFWALTGQIVDPLLKLGYENTSPAIERSVLLRMGFSSIEVKPIVDGALERGLLGHGAGNIVYKLANSKGVSIRDAGLALSRGELWDDAAALFTEVAK